jgi:PAS domain S-box-containing protein
VARRGPAGREIGQNRRVVPSGPSDGERLQEQRQVLGRAARLLASASDFEGTLRQTLAACLPALGDFGFFDFVAAPGEVRRTSAAHEAPHIEALLAPTQWVRQVHPSLNLCALSTGEAALHPQIGEDWYRQVAANEQHLRLLRELAFRSMITVPVRYRDELVGALTLFMGSSGRRHTADHLELAGELALLAAPLVVTARLVAQHEASEAALRHSSEQLHMAVEAGQVGIWDWNIAAGEVSWSDRVYAMHGMPPGSDTGGLAGFRARVHPEDLPRVEAALRSALEGGPQYAVEFRAPRADGTIRWISTRSELVRDAAGRPLRMLGANIDIPERMELLAAARAARREAEEARHGLDLLARAGAMLARGSLDPEETLRAIAAVIVPEVADWCRIDLLDENGAPQARMAHHSDPARAARALDAARGMRASAQTVGSLAWCMARSQPHYGRFDEPPEADDAVLREYTGLFGMRVHYIVPLVARGRTIGAMGVVQAESGRDLAEADRALVQELAYRAALALDNARAYAEAEAARHHAENASRAKDEFLAMLGHELRNPLAPIATALELMSRRDAGAHLEERRIIGRQVQHLSRLIDDLLDVSRITQGKVDLQRQPLDLRTAVRQALEQTQPVFQHRAAPVQVRLPERAVCVHGDLTRLTQVLCNLLTNAAKFTPADGEVRLALREAGGQAELAVEDCGRGIEPELLPRVFDLFVQGRQSLDRRAGGLGLGLGIVRMLVRMHGGDVQAESEGPGQGSRFTVRLPTIRQERLGPESPDAQQARPASAAGQARLLVVDDNTDAAQTLADLLRVLGYEVRCAGDAGSAMDLLDSYVPQLALLDIGLPGEDGYALAARMRADTRMAGARLVALTGYGSDKDRERALSSHFDEHLVKPVRPERLFATLDRLLASGYAAPAGASARAQANPLAQAHWKL